VHVDLHISIFLELLMIKSEVRVIIYLMLKSIGPRNTMSYWYKYIFETEYVVHYSKHHLVFTDDTYS